jgi:hypothetical protein
MMTANRPCRYGKRTFLALLLILSAPGRAEDAGWRLTIVPSFETLAPLTKPIPGSRTARLAVARHAGHGELEYATTQGALRYAQDMAARHAREWIEAARVDQRRDADGVITRVLIKSDDPMLPALAAWATWLAGDNVIIWHATFLSQPTSAMLWLLAVGCLLAADAAPGVRLKDLCTVDGVRDNQLNGIGIVVGLSGTGDKSPATKRLLRQVLAAGEVTRARIEGAIALYLLVALLFATAYETLEGFAPGSFAGATALPQSFRYFSLVAQTSTGFGDIVPTTPLARTLVTLQAVTGQIFIAVLLARLVSLELAARAEKRQG